jgi:hypothetical protein
MKYKPELLIMDATVFGVNSFLRGSAISPYTERFIPECEAGHRDRTFAVGSALNRLP